MSNEMSFSYPCYDQQQLTENEHLLSSKHLVKVYIIEFFNKPTMWLPCLFPLNSSEYIEFNLRKVTYTVSDWWS